MKINKLFLFTFFLLLAALLCSRQLKASAAERVPALYTQADAEALAKMAWGEAGAVKDQLLSDGRIISSTAQKAAVMWTALNQYDAGIADSLLGVIEKPHNFYGYDENHPVKPDLLLLAFDVLDRWERERQGETDVGRVLPADYIYFTGDGKYNYFRNEFKTNVYYDWRLEDIYADEISGHFRITKRRLEADPAHHDGRFPKVRAEAAKRCACFVGAGLPLQRRGQ